MDGNPLNLILIFAMFIAMTAVAGIVLMMILAYEFKIIRVEKQSPFFKWSIRLGLISSIIFWVII